MSLSFRIFTLASVLFLTSAFSTANASEQTINGEVLIHIDVKSAQQDSLYDTQYRSRDSKRKHNLEREMAKIAEENHQLRRRLRKMERAMIQLQQAVITLEGQQFEQPPIPTGAAYSCMLQTRNNGTYLGKGDSRMEAEANARIACDEKAGSFWCKADIKCEKSNGF